jgi:selT/selW/selH-like putative selenoprotein
LIRSSGGVFEVTVGNDLIFSKKKAGRFPYPGEVESELEARVSA